MPLSLKLRSGDVEPCPELQFDAPRIVVGRNAGCELQLPDPSVSGRHASIRQRGSEYVVVDEGSDNGTFSGLSRLGRLAPHPLSDGELLRFGRVWVEVKLTPGSAAAEPALSRELARTLVERALESDGKPCGMSVGVTRAGAAGGALQLAVARKAYVVGSQKSADLRIDDPALPRRALELRRQGDQLWVTALSAAAHAAIDGRELGEGQRTLWPRGVVLTLGEAQLTLADPTAEMLERLEKEPVERIDPDAIIDPPEGCEDDAAETSSDGDAQPEEEPHEREADAGRRASKPGIPPRSARATASRHSRWTRADAFVLLLAVGVLGLSLWAIQWLAHDDASSSGVTTPRDLRHLLGRAALPVLAYQVRSGPVSFGPRFAAGYVRDLVGILRVAPRAAGFIRSHLHGSVLARRGASASSFRGASEEGRGPVRSEVEL